MVVGEPQHQTASLQRENVAPTKGIVTSITNTYF